MAHLGRHCAVVGEHAQARLRHTGQRSLLSRGGKYGCAVPFLSEATPTNGGRAGFIQTMRTTVPSGSGTSIPAPKPGEILNAAVADSEPITPRGDVVEQRPGWSAQREQVEALCVDRAGTDVLVTHGDLVAAVAGE